MLLSGQKMALLRMLGLAVHGVVSFNSVRMMMSVVTMGHSVLRLLRFYLLLNY